MPEDTGNSKRSFFGKFFGTKSKALEEQKTEEEILNLVEEGREKGYFKDETENFIKNVFDFDDTTASEIMTHRTDITAVEDTLSLKEIVAIAIESGHSRIPVYHDDIDNIVGILYVKDLLKFVGEDIPEDFEITSITRTVPCVPRSKNLSRLFAEMTKKKIQLAIVVDEYGGTEGIITLEDLVEDIMGNIQDEYDNEDEESHKLSENKFTVDGAMTLDDVSELINYEFPETDCDTIAGFILEKTGKVPTDGEHPVVFENNLKLTVLKVEERRITEILIEKNIKENEG